MKKAWIVDLDNLVVYEKPERIAILDETEERIGYIYLTPGGDTAIWWFEEKGHG